MLSGSRLAPVPAGHSALLPPRREQIKRPRTPNLRRRLAFVNQSLHSAGGDGGPVAAAPPSLPPETESALGAQRRWEEGRPVFSCHVQWLLSFYVIVQHRSPWSCALFLPAACDWSGDSYSVTSWGSRGPLYYFLCCTGLWEVP